MNFDSRILVGILALGIGLAMVVGTGAATYVLQVTVAESVDAEVVSSGVAEEACSTDAACDVRYAPAVTYRYTYDGAEYTSESVYPAAAQARSISRDTAASTASEFAAGDRVTAQVLPMMPGTAYLRSNTPGIATVGLGGLGLLMALAGANGVQQGLRGVEPQHDFE